MVKVYYVTAWIRKNSCSATETNSIAQEYNITCEIHLHKLVFWRTMHARHLSTLNNAYNI